MQINLTGTGEFGLDGQYEIDPQPNTRELTRFRKEAGLSPSEMLDALSNGGLEIVPLYIYTALQRQGQSALAVKVLEVPFDLWVGAQTITRDDDDQEAAVEEEAEAQLPPT